MKWNFLINQVALFDSWNFLYRIFDTDGKSLTKVNETARTYAFWKFRILLQQTLCLDLWINSYLFFIQKQPPDVFCEKRCRKTLEILFNKVAGLWDKCFLVNIVKLLRTPILKNICQRLPTIASVYFQNSKRRNLKHGSWNYSSVIIGIYYSEYCTGKV